MPNPIENQRLIRSIRKWELLALAINGIVGAGIFGLPSKVFALSGSFSLAAYAACGAFTGLIVLCFAEVGSRFSGTGGPYLYAREAFGPVVGFEVGWLMWLVRLTAFAANCNLLADYVAYFIPAASSGVGRVGFDCAVMLCLLAINYRGIRLVTFTSNLLTGGKLLALGLFVAAGLFFVDWSQLAAFPMPVGGSFSISVLLLVYAFTGFEMATIPAGEAQEPRRSLPVALIVAVAISAGLYFLIQLVCIGTLPDLANSAKPLADASRRFLGPAGAAAITLGAVISITGNLNILLLAGSRIPFAMAERRELPAFLARTHRRFHTPHAALIVTGLLMLLLTVSGTFAYALTISAISRVVVYMATCAALPALRRSEEHPALFRLRYGRIVSVAACVVAVWLLAHASWREGRDTLLAAVAGLLVYGAVQFRGKRAE